MAQNDFKTLFLGHRVVGEATAAPTTGSYNQGDFFYNSAPVASGTMGWVCVATGAPGTWKTFGAIAA